MKIALLEIENFRGIKSGKVVFGDHSVLIGPNNSGKTTVVVRYPVVVALKPPNQIVRHPRRSDLVLTDLRNRPPADAAI